MLACEPERKGFWYLWLPAHRLQFAGAALLAGVIVVSMVSVRHTDGKAPVTQIPTPVPAQSGSFGTAAAQGRPASLKPIPVPTVQGKKKKPSAGHSAKHGAKTAVATGEPNAAPVAP